VEAVLALTGEVIRHLVGRGDKSACGQHTELSRADNARGSCCSPAEQPKDGGVLIATGEHGVNCAATQGWRCRKRLSGAASVDSVSRLALSAWAGGTEAAEVVEKVRAWSLGVDDPAGSRDNKSAAEVGKRHHLQVASGALGRQGWSGVAERRVPSP